MVMVRPGKTTNHQGGMSPEARAFAEEAARYFESRGIPYLDFVDDERIRLEHYASGDHYNAAGRRILTERVAEALRSAPPRARP